MILLPTGTKIWLVAGITDMRNGFNGLAVKVQTAPERRTDVRPCSSSGAAAAVRLNFRSTGDGLCPADQTAGARALRPAVSSRWQSVPHTGTAGDAPLKVSTGGSLKRPLYVTDYVGRPFIPVDAE